jgi:hypothetical protein
MAPARIRDDVCCTTGLGSDACDPVIRAGLLAQESDGYLGDCHRVGGVDAEFGICTGVRWLSLVGHFQLGYRGAGHCRHFGRGRVNHHCRVESLERPAFEHQYFTAAAFLAGCTEYGDGQSQVIGESGEAESCADSGGCDYVVAAGVSDFGKCIVFRADANVQWAGADRGPHGSRQVIAAVLHIEAGFLEGIGYPGACVDFFECQFRMGMDPVGQVDEGAGTCSNPCLYCGFHR